MSTISSRARKLGSSDASAASRLLISPRTRLPAELSFLPGATAQQVDGCLRSLREGGEPDLWPFAPIARANVLAHLASSGKATPSQLRDLVSMQETAPSTAMEAVNRGRTDASMPPAPPEMADAALQTLAGQHAEALVDGLLAHENGSEFLSELLRGSGGAVTPRVIFLRQCAAGWERVKSSDLSRILETAELIEAVLHKQPEPDSARKLACIIEQFAGATSPPRAAARLLGLSHEPSVDARRRWHALALVLNNQLDAVPEAVTVLEALADGFDDPDELGAMIVKNLHVCRERVAAGEGTTQVRRLAKAIAAAKAEPADFDHCGMVDGRKTPACPTAVAELHDSFVAAAESAISELPWAMLRNLTLLLHNEHGATTAAWSLTVLAIAQADRNEAAAPILPLLTSDKRNLRAQLLQRELEVAIRSKRKGAMRTIVAELLPLVDAPTDKAEYTKLLEKLWSQALFGYLRWGVCTVVAGLLLLGFVNKEQTPIRTAAAPTTFRSVPTSSPVPAPVPAVISPMERVATQPLPGNTNLSISGLRWCRYQQVRADGAEAYLEVLRPDPALKFDRFNAAVAAYNAFVLPLNASCVGFTYRKSDASIIDAEVNEQRATLAAAGRRAMESVYLVEGTPASASVPTYPANSTYISPAPAASVNPPSMPRPRYVAPPAQAPAMQQPDIPPTTPFNPSYVEGQNDRRAWEVWMGSTSGAARDGAEWWAGVRSAQRPPPCSAVPASSDSVAAAAGCNQARIRLGNYDRRRRAEPEYRAGWNSP